MPQTQLPANFASFLSLSAQQQMDLGVPVVPLDGTQAFTVSGWFQVPDTDDTVTVLSQSTLFAFSFYERRPTVTMRVGTVALRMTQPLSAGKFHQLAATYAPGAGGTNGLLTFYVDDALVGEASVTPATPAGGAAPHLVLGDGIHALMVRRVWLTDTVVPASSDEGGIVDTRFGTTGTAPFATQSTWDWGQVPAAILGAPQPVALGGATTCVTTPGLAAGPSGGVSFALATPVALSRATLQGWFFFPAGVSSSQVFKEQVLVEVTGDSGYFALTATPSSTGTWELMFLSPHDSFGKTSLVLEGWHNLAVTCADGGPAMLYLDGVLLVQSGSESVSFSVTAATINIASGSAINTFPFSGWVQNVALWNVMLPGEDIQACLMPWFPLQDTDPLAVCDFSLEPPADVVSGEPIALVNGATVQEQFWPTSVVAPSTQMLVAQPKRRQALKHLRPQNPPTPDPSRWTPQRENELLQQLQGYLNQAGTDPRARAEGPALVTKLQERFARGRAGDPDLTGIVHTERQGDEWVTFHYGVNGPQAILRRNVTNFKTDPCFNWVVDFTATALFGLLDIMGIPLSTGVAAKALQKLLGKAKIWKAVGEVIEGTLTSMSIIALLKAIYDGGGLTAFVKAVLDNVSWWDFLWMVAQVLLELIGLLVPGVEEALILAKCVLVVAQLSVLMADRPAGCPS